MSQQQTKTIAITTSTTTKTSSTALPSTFNATTMPKRVSETYKDDKSVDDDGHKVENRNEKDNRRLP